uniref:cache domain-containing protein n=2 Tax=Campylobacter jejuni TaxID=197 RepID=UPI001642E255
MFKSLNISSKLTLSVAFSVFIAIVTMILIVSFKVSSLAEKQAKDEVLISSKRYTNFVQGILNEPIGLTKGTSILINEMLEENDQISMPLVEHLLQSFFDSSGYAAYAFLYLKDPSVLSDTNAMDKKFKSQDGHFAMIFHDRAIGKSGGIETIQTPNNFSQLQIIRKVEQSSKHGDKDSIFIGSPTKLNYDGDEFLGINFAMPIFNKQGKFVGVMGYTLNLVTISSFITDPKLDMFEGDIRQLITDQGIITINKEKDSILKNIADINHDSTVSLIIEAAKKHTDVLLDDYIASTGDPSYASVSSFSTLGGSSYWSVVVTAPKKSVLKPLYELQFTIVAVSIIAIVLILCIVYLCIKKIVGSRIPIILQALENFFRFLNHERIEVKAIEIKSDDELGKMGKIINENILQTKKGLEQDNQAVKESVETVHVVESGNLTARITANP